MSGDHHVDAFGGRVEVESLEVVQYVEGQPADLQQQALGDVRRPVLVSLLPRTTESGARRSSSARISGLPMSPAWINWSQPRNRSSASGRSRPWCRRSGRCATGGGTGAWARVRVAGRKRVADGHGHAVDHTQPLAGYENPSAKTATPPGGGAAPISVRPSGPGFPAGTSSAAGRRCRRWRPRTPARCAAPRACARGTPAPAKRPGRGPGTRR